MFFVFFLLWVAFNGRLTWEIAAFGAVLSGVLYAFCCAFLGYSPKKDWAAARLIPAALRYVGLLLTEIVKCNLALTRIVFAPPEARGQAPPGHLPHPAEGWVQECAGGFHYADARHHHRSQRRRPPDRPLPGYAVHGRH